MEIIEDYKNLFSTIRDAILVVDIERKIKDCNPAFTSMFGYTLEEIKGKSAGIFYENEKVYDEIGRKINENRQEEKSFIYTLNYKRKNGEVFTGEVNIFFIKDAQEKKGGVMGLIRDISERKKAEELLLENAIQFNILKNTSIDGFWLVNKSGQFLDVNSAYCRMTGYSKDELKKMIIPDLEAVEPPEITRRHIQKIIETGSDRFESIHRCKDGRHINVEISVTYIKHSGKMMCFIHDITKRKKADAILRQKTEELIRSNKELEQFAYISSHDLQEPLRTVSNFVGLLNSNYKGRLDNEADEYIEYIERATKRMQKLIKDVMDYLIIGRKKDVSPVNCNEILQEVLDELASSVRNSNAVIHSGPLPVISVHPELKSVFFNLLSNALKFRKKDNSPLVINFSVRDIGKEWLFAIKDNGIGIDRKYHERIFLIFQRLHKHEDYPGTGIGLAHSKKIIEMHGGKIRVESEPGQGSTFYFTVPKQETNQL